MSINTIAIFFSWLYRMRPSVVHNQFVPIELNKFTNNFANLKPNPNQFRWHPHPIPTDGTVDFVDVRNHSLFFILTFAESLYDVRCGRTNDA